jgi:hypothetical protein
MLPVEIGLQSLRVTE